MKKNRSFTLLIIFLFFFSLITSTVIGFNHINTLNVSSFNNRYRDYYCRDGSQEVFYNKEKSLKYLYDCDSLTDIRHYPKAINKVEMKSTKESSNTMDSPWPMKCHDTKHTGLSPYSTVDNYGIELWRFKTDNWIEGGPIIGKDGTIYFGAFDEYLYALYPDGSLKWKFKTNDWIWSTPALAEDGTIYIGNYGNNFYAVNSNGTLKWKFRAEGPISSSPAISSDGTIYFGVNGPGSEGRIHAINPDGSEKWCYDECSWIVSDPAIGEDGTIYIGSTDGNLYAMNPDGTLKWHFKTGDWVKSHPSIADDGTIYFDSFDHYLYALYPNGNLKWKYHGSYAGSSSVSIGNDGTIYGAGDNSLLAINPDGTLKWNYYLGDKIFIGHSSPAISADGTIFVGTHFGETGGGDIIAINTDGTEKWKKRIGNLWVSSSPCINKDGTIYIGSSTLSETGVHSYFFALGIGEFTAYANGPYSGIINQPIEFNGYASGGSRPYSFEWDFGDGNKSYEQNPNKTYTKEGNYTVTLTVTDATDGSNSTVTDTTYALIRSSNSPPDKPSISGKTRGEAGTYYDYTISTVDPEGDEVSFFIDWGDGSTEGWTRYKPSGKEIYTSHMWEDRDTYNIRAKSKDTLGAESEWTTLTVTMPKSSLFQNLFNRIQLQRFAQKAVFLTLKSTPT